MFHLSQIQTNFFFFLNSTAKCIDLYTKLKVHNYEHPDEPKEIDPRLEAVVNRMFKRCFDDKKFKQAVGIALETRRLDVFKEAILKSDDIPAMLSYSVKVVMSLLQERQFGNTVSKLPPLFSGCSLPINGRQPSLKQYHGYGDEKLTV